MRSYSGQHYNWSFGLLDICTSTFGHLYIQMCMISLYFIFIFPCVSSVIFILRSSLTVVKYGLETFKATKSSLELLTFWFVLFREWNYLDYGQIKCCIAVRFLYILFLLSLKSSTTLSISGNFGHHFSFSQKTDFFLCCCFHCFICHFRQVFGALSTEFYCSQINAK